MGLVDSCWAAAPDWEGRVAVHWASASYLRTDIRGKDIRDREAPGLWWKARSDPYAALKDGSHSSSAVRRKK